jgi:probable phosphoglycerate mutase
MTTFLLIRHGRTSWIGRAIAGHSPGVSLDESGIVQAEQLVGRLEALPLAAIYCSPLQRTLETAAPLARHRGLTVTQRPRLIEVDFGQWTGKTLAELDQDPRWRAFNEVRSINRAPGGESMLEVQARIIEELDNIRRSHPGQTVAIFSHQDSIKAAIAHYAGMPLDLFHRFEISPASISIVSLAEWGPRIVSVNAGPA